MILLKTLLREGFFSKEPPEEYNPELGFQEIVKYIYDLPNVHKNSVAIEKVLDSKTGKYVRFVSFDPTTKEHTRVVVMLSAKKFFVLFDKEMVFQAPYAFSVIDFLSKHL